MASMNQRAKSSQRYRSGTRAGRAYTVRRRNNNGALVFLSLVALAVIIGFLYYGYSVLDTVKQYENTFYPNVYVDNINLEGMTKEQAITYFKENKQNHVNNWFISLYFNGAHWTLTAYDIDAHLDIDQQVEQAWQQGRTGSVFERYKNIKNMETHGSQGRLSFNYNLQRVEEFLQNIKSQVDQAPIDASFRFSPDLPGGFSISDEIYGRTLDIEALRSVINDSINLNQSNEIVLEPTPVAPQVTAAQLREITSLRAMASTQLSKSSTEDRNHNVILGCSMINGVVINPGKTGSFNDIVGPRTVQTGYREALEIVSGEYQPGIGGGICQVSTTLYQAWLKAGLEVTYRKEHSIPTGYTELAFDATVYYDSVDFKFKNNTKSPVYIMAGVNGKTVTVSIFGESLGNISYELQSVQTEQISPGEPERVMDSDYLYTSSSKREVTRNRRDGFKAELYLLKYENGQYTGQNKKINSSYYREKAGTTYLWPDDYINP